MVARGQDSIDDYQKDEGSCSRFDLNQLGGLRYGASGHIGRRPSMEDAVCHRVDLPVMHNASFFGIFDGHAGRNAATYSSQVLVQKLTRNLMAMGMGTDASSPASAQQPTTGHSVQVSSWPPILENPANNRITNAVNNAFNETDSMIGEVYRSTQGTRHLQDPGCTASCVLVTDDYFVFANLGDSRALLCSDGKLTFATEDHKPTSQEEKDRICNAGGFVLRGRVMATLAVSRALGDHQFKDQDLPWAEQMVSSVPTVTFIDRNIARDDFLLMACDGVWDVMTNESAIKFALAGLETGASPAEVAARLIAFALKRGSTDNLSVIIIDMRPKKVTKTSPRREIRKQFSSHSVLPPIGLTTPSQQQNIRPPPPNLSRTTESKLAAISRAPDDSVTLL